MVPLGQIHSGGPLLRNLDALLPGVSLLVLVLPPSPGLSPIWQAQVRTVSATWGFPYLVPSGKTGVRWVAPPPTLMSSGERAVTQLEAFASVF